MKFWTLDQRLNNLAISLIITLTLNMIPFVTSQKQMRVLLGSRGEIKAIFGWQR